MKDDLIEHLEITDRKTLTEIFDDFEVLLGMCLLFQKDSNYYKFSGLVTAALFEWELGADGSPITVLAILTNSGMITFKYTVDDLTKMFNHCEAFIGRSPEESFLLHK